MQYRRPNLEHATAGRQSEGYDRDPRRRRSMQDREQDIARRRAYQMQALAKLKKP